MRHWVFTFLIGSMCCLTCAKTPAASRISIELPDESHRHMSTVQYVTAHHQELFVRCRNEEHTWSSHIAFEFCVTLLRALSHERLPGRRGSARGWREFVRSKNMFTSVSMCTREKSVLKGAFRALRLPVPWGKFSGPLHDRCRACTEQGSEFGDCSMCRPCTFPTSQIVSMLLEDPSLSPARKFDKLDFAIVHPEHNSAVTQTVYIRLHCRNFPVGARFELSLVQRIGEVPPIVYAPLEMRLSPVMLLVVKLPYQAFYKLMFDFLFRDQIIGRRESHVFCPFVHLLGAPVSQRLYHSHKPLPLFLSTGYIHRYIPFLFNVSITVGPGGQIFWNDSPDPVVHVNVVANATYTVEATVYDGPIAIGHTRTYEFKTQPSSVSPFAGRTVFFNEPHPGTSRILLGWANQWHFNVWQGKPFGIMGSHETFNSFCPWPHALRRDYFRNHYCHAKNVDLFVCFYQLAQCELYMPFDKPMLLWGSMPFEIGRENRKRFNDLVYNLRTMATSARVVIGAYSRFDVQYIRYWTGLAAEKVIHVPFIDPSLVHSYRPSHPDVLVSRNTFFPNLWARECNEAARARGVPLSFVNMLSVREGKSFDHYSLSEFSRYRAVVVFPYYHATLTVSELYHAGIPIFFPSLPFLIKLVRERCLLMDNSRRFQWMGKTHIVDPPAEIPHNPNDLLTDVAAAEYWLGLLEEYHLPHIQYFDSLDHLMSLLVAADFLAISAGMKEHAAQSREASLAQFNDIFTRLFSSVPRSAEYSPEEDQRLRSQPRRPLNSFTHYMDASRQAPSYDDDVGGCACGGCRDFDVEMKRLWNIKLSREEPSCKRRIEDDADSAWPAAAFHCHTRYFPLHLRIKERERLLVPLKFGANITHAVIQFLMERSLDASQLGSFVEQIQKHRQHHKWVRDAEAAFSADEDYQVLYPVQGDRLFWAITTLDYPAYANETNIGFPSVAKFCESKLAASLVECGQIHCVFVSPEQCPGFLQFVIASWLSYERYGSLP